MTLEANWMDKFNELGTMAGGAHRMISLSTQELIDAAEQTTGLTDFGTDDWKGKLNHWITSIETDASLHTLGRLIEKSTIIRLLQNRLLINDLIKKKPEIQETAIIEPVFITGNPRTGTSILFETLAQDSHFRAPLAWEVEYPAGLPTKTDTKGIKPEEFGKATSDLIIAMQPKLKALHEIGWNLPIECSRVMAPSLEYHRIGGASNTSERIERYYWHKKVLQILAHGKPSKQWLLKCPSHQQHLELLFETYPDAKIIYTHRDPAKSLASLLGVLDALLNTLGSYDAANYFGKIIENIEGSLRKVIQLRESGRLKDRKIYDLRYTDFIRSPVEMLDRIHSHLNLPSKPETRERMLSYFNNKAKYAGGIYRFNLEEFGFSEKEIRQRFRFYSEYFGIENE